VSAPEKLIIDTPEQIALEYSLASAGSRFLALGIDTLLQLVAFAFLGLIAVSGVYLGTRVFAGIATWLLALLLVAAFLLYYGYFAMFEALWSGQTPGKRAIGIRVIVASGRPLGPFDAILRNLLRIVDQMPGMYAVGLLSIFLTQRNQRLGDLAAGTVVVHDRAIERPAMPDAVRAPVRYGAHRLTPEEVALVETFLQRRHALEPDVRLATARRIVERVVRRLSLSMGSSAMDPSIDEERLLEEIVREYRTR
jgi:uncharacterized RDD family membrane protein YckC